MKKKLLAANFFEGATELFDEDDFVWQAIPKLADFIKSKSQKKVSIGKGTIIHPSAEIIGPAIIGKNCTLGPHAYLRENCLIGDNVHIGHSVEIKNSIIMDGTAVAHLNYIGDSIVGKNVNISGGAMLANLRLDRRPVSIKMGSRKIETGLEKFGAIVGDDSFIGVNAVLNPGTILGKRAKVYPLVSVRGVYGDDSTIKISK